MKKQELNAPDIHLIKGLIIESLAKDGGTVIPWDGEGSPGITLRDYFAGQALSGVLAYSGDEYFGTPRDAATHCYALAEAMLKERMKWAKNDASED